MLTHDRRGSGSPLVLLHGIGHRLQAWEPVMDRLAAHHDVIAVDLPGFGASPMLPDGHRYDVPGALAALTDAFAEFGVERPHVAGNSLGGMLALELASRGLVRSATALAPAGFWTPWDRAWAIRVLGVVRRLGRTPERFQAALCGRRLVRVVGGSLLFGKPSVLTAEVMVADLVAMGAGTGFDAVLDSGAREYLWTSAPPAVPVSVAWGTRDRILWPRQAGKARELLPDATHVWLPGCGHVPMGDDPELVASTILATCAESPAA
ncbi:alpha/beta hydrolase [Actinokineospora auranticolor]|uniref:Pimeloyl-ACP methyl ester carboxylesterase n=1 Tax=Actinokineospora auranticolor TaxID=155976 RepID=A0A2S6GYQ5_9PSEU|nr:alpha/beta hydrolase [Actinokineospora auranticolor]PPK70296.1 pimeloyl-ACP methyl ester carboxylesterase [Actinokineospora auranticolor]